MIFLAILSFSLSFIASLKSFIKLSDLLVCEKTWLEKSNIKPMEMYDVITSGIENAVKIAN